jgi:hypothetical protein
LVGLGEVNALQETARRTKKNSAAPDLDADFINPFHLQKLRFRIDRDQWWRFGSKMHLAHIPPHPRINQVVN